MNACLSVPVFLQLPCQFNLFGQGVQIDQDKAREVVRLYCFVFGNFLNVVQGIVAKRTQFMGPFLQSARQFSLRGKIFDALIQRCVLLFWRFVFGNHFQCTSVHGGSGVKTICANADIGFNECACYGFWKVLGGGGWLSFGKKFQIRDISTVKQVPMNYVVWS